MNLSKINLGINDLKKERDHVKNLIIKTDERIDKLMRELRKTEPKTQESTPQFECILLVGIVILHYL